MAMNLVHLDRPPSLGRPRLPMPSVKAFTLISLALLSVSVQVFHAQLVLARPPEFDYGNGSTTANWTPHLVLNEGSPISLTCPIITTGVEIAWLQNGKTLPVTSSLFFKPTATRADAGAFRCVASNAFGSVLARETRVDIQYLDDFDGTDEDLYSLSAAAGGFILRRPPLLASLAIRPLFLWYCNEAEVYGNSSHYLTANGDLVVLDSGGRVPMTEECAVTAAVDGLNEIRSRTYTINRVGGGEARRFGILYGPWDRDVILSAEDAASSSTPDLVFDCVPSQSDATVRWFLSGHELAESTGASMAGVLVDRSGRRLSLGAAAAARLLPPGSVRLECRAEAAAGRVNDSRFATLTVFRVPRVRRLRAEISRRQHDSLQLECLEDGEIKAQGTAVKWMFNGVQISRSGRLSLPDLSPASFGVYQCEASNSAGSNLRSVWLKEGDRTADDDQADVLFPSTLASHDDDAANEEDPFSSSAVASGVVEGQEMIPHAPDSPARFTPVLPAFSPENILDRPLAASSSHAAVASISRSPSLIVAPEGRVVVPSGTANFSLPCQAAGLPLPLISWRVNNSEPLRPSAKYVLGERGLTVHDVRRADAGVYECEARNENGVARAAATVLVQGGSLLEYGPTNQSILIGSNIEIPCQVAEEYTSSAAISWFIKGQRIGNSGDPTLRVSRDGKKGALLIKQVGPDNIGDYRCVVRVGEREESASAWLQIVEKPGMPKFVKADLLNDTKPAKVRVSWRAGFDGNSPILRHAIEMRTLSTAAAQPHWADWERVVESVPPESCCSYVLDNVRPSSTAQFRVIAANRHGSGMPSQSSGNVTLPQMPPAAAPTKVHATARGPRTVMVQWQRPASDQWNGDINGYLVRHRLNGYTVPWITANITDGGRMNFAVENLLVWKEYEFQVAAYNSRGEGVFSPSVITTTLEGPPSQAPKRVSVEVLNATAIRARFTQPDEQFINGVNLGYKVQLREMRETSTEGDFIPDENGGVVKEQQVEPDGVELETVINGLRPWGHYTLSVLCFTSAGPGPQSASEKVVLDEWTPGAVDDLHVDAAALFSEALVLWRRPKEPNGRILRYEVRHWSESSPDDVNTMEVAGTVENVTLNGLAASTKYVVDVRAATSKGDGVREETRFESGVPPELPGRPSSLSVSNITARSVELSFAPGFDGHSPIRMWHVEGRTGEASLFHAIYNVSAPKARSITVHELRPFTSYQLRLIAENVRGRGAPSEPSKIFKTAQTAPEAPSSKLWAEPVSSSSITLSWTPLQASQWNGQPIGYLVTYRPANETGRDSSEEDDDGLRRWKEVRTRSLRATELTLKGLKPWTEYELLLYAENVFGRSAPAGAGVLARTYEGAPLAAPRKVRVERAPGPGGTITVHWAPVPESKRGGEILGYKVLLYPEETRLRSIHSRNSTIGSPSQLSETFSHLRAATAFFVEVAAFTLVGEGPRSRPAIEHTADDVPGPPSSVGFSLVKLTEARVRFLPPEDPNAVISQYIVTYHRADDVNAAANRVTAPLPPTMFSFAATGLSPRTRYIFGVAAQNSQGTGEAAVVEMMTVDANSTLPLANPSVPMADMRRARSAHDIAIQWTEETAEASPHLMTSSGEEEVFWQQPVRGVQVEYQRSGESNWTRVVPDLAGSVNKATVLRLSPNTEYSFRVRFSGDDASHSAWSAPSAWLRTLPAAPAAPPHSIHLTPSEPDAVTVSFLPPERSSWNADAIGFSIYYREYPSESSLWKEAAITERSEFPSDQPITHVIKGLPGFRHYVVQIRSVTSDGFSPPSVPWFVYVGFAVPRYNVTGLVAEPHSATSIAVRWLEWPEEQRQQISGFKIRFAPVLSVLSKDSEQDGLVVVEENAVVLSDLLKYTEYQISVSPYNRAGEGAAAVTRIATLEDVPGPVGVLRFSDVTLDSVRVSWDEPAEKNGRIVAYVISYRMHHMRSDTRKEQQVTVERPSVVATGLDESAIYFFSIRAENGAGKGPEVTGNVTIGPVPDGPPAPSIPTLTPGQASVVVEWEHPPSPTSTPLRHLVQAKRVAQAPPSNATGVISSRGDESNHRRRRSHSSAGGAGRPTHIIGDWVTMSSGEGDSVEINYADLHPSSFYVFRIFSRNEAGIGQPSGESEQLLVPETLPSEWFYTSPWFLVVAGLCLLLLFVSVIACLCVTGARKKRATSHSGSIDSSSESKKNGKKRKNKKGLHSPSSDSMQFDGNFPLQTKKRAGRRGGQASGGGASHLRRHELLVRPDTTTSWMSEREHAAVGYGSSGGASGSSPGDGVPNMFGLATDVLPALALHSSRADSSSEYGMRLADHTHYVHHQQPPPSLSTYQRPAPPRPGPGIRSNGVLLDNLGMQQTPQTPFYGSATIRIGSGPGAYGIHSQSEGHRESDSFDDDDDFDEDDHHGRSDETMVGDDVASHYAEADKYRSTWRSMRDEGTLTRVGNASSSSMLAPPSYHAPPPLFGQPISFGGGSSHAHSVRSASSSNNPGAAAESSSAESCSEHSWQPPSQQAPPLQKFSSFV